MFKRTVKKRNILVRLILKLLKIYAVERESFNLINPQIYNRGKSTFILNDKSFIFPTGYVEIDRKIKSVNIIYRYCSSVNLWGASKKWRRIIPNINKETLILSCINSLIVSINHFVKNYGNKVKIHINLVDDGHDNEFNKVIFNILEKDNIYFSYYKNPNTGNQKSFLFSLELCKKFDDLVFFVEDDYLFEDSAIEELILSYSRISSAIKSEIFICPSDYSFYYDKLYHTSLILGANKKFRFVGETLMTILTSRKVIDDNYNKLKQIALEKNDPFEKPLHEIYKNIPCFAPIGALAYHVSTEAPGLSPHSDWKKVWDKNFTTFRP